MLDGELAHERVSVALEPAQLAAAIGYQDARAVRGDGEELGAGGVDAVLERRLVRRRMAGWVDGQAIHLEGALALVFAAGDERVARVRFRGLDLGDGELAVGHGVGFGGVVGVREGGQAAEAGAGVVGCADLGKEASIVGEDGGEAAGGVVGAILIVGVVIEGAGMDGEGAAPLVGWGMESCVVDGVVVLHDEMEARSGMALGRLMGQ